MRFKSYKVQTAYLEDVPDSLSFYKYGKFKVEKIARSAQRKIPGVDFGDYVSYAKGLIRVVSSPGHDVLHMVQRLLGKDVQLKEETGLVKYTSSEDAARRNTNDDAASSSASVVPSLEPLYLCMLQTEVDEENNGVKLSSEAESALIAMANSTIKHPVYICDYEDQRSEVTIKQRISEVTNKPVNVKYVLSCSDVHGPVVLMTILKKKLKQCFEYMVKVLITRKNYLSRNVSYSGRPRAEILHQIECLMESLRNMMSLLSVKKKKNEITNRLKEELERYQDKGLTAYVYCFGKINVYVSKETNGQTKCQLEELLESQFDIVEVHDAENMIRPLSATCPGAQIYRANDDPPGTLGCFGTLDGPSSLAAITAYHVIPLNQLAHIKLQSGAMIPIGKCIFGYQPPVQRVNLSDIGVVEIPAENTNHCNQTNLDRQGHEKSLILNTTPSPRLETRFVFKRGGSTNLTNGFIISNTAAYFQDDSPADLIVIESNSVEDEPFAEEGDCGSVVIWHPEPSHEMYAVSVIVGCVVKVPNLPEGSVISTRMDTAIQKCRSSLQRNINIV